MTSKLYNGSVGSGIFGGSGKHILSLPLVMSLPPLVMSLPLPLCQLSLRAMVTSHSAAAVFSTQTGRLTFIERTIAAVVSRPREDILRCLSNEGALSFVAASFEEAWQPFFQHQPADRRLLKERSPRSFHDLAKTY